MLSDTSKHIWVNYKAVPSEWPANRVFDCARLVVLFLDAPELLDSYAVGLRLTLFPEAELRKELLSEVPMTTLRKNGALGMKFHSALESSLSWKNPY